LAVQAGAPTSDQVSNRNSVVQSITGMPQECILGIDGAWTSRQPSGVALVTISSITTKIAVPRNAERGTSVLPGEPQGTARFDIGLEAAQDFRPRPRTASGKLAVGLKSCLHHLKLHDLCACGDGRDRRTD